MAVNNHGTAVPADLQQHQEGADNDRREGFPAFMVAQ